VAVPIFLPLFLPAGKFVDGDKIKINANAHKFMFEKVV